MHPVWTPPLATLRRAVLYRTAIGILLAILAIAWGGTPPLDRLRLLDLFPAVAVVIGTGLWVFLRLRVGGRPFHLALVLVAGDLAATTLLVWFSGPINGPLVFLYPLAVVSSSFLLGPGVSYYAAAAAFLLQGVGYLIMGGPGPQVATQGLVLNGLLLVALAALSDGLASRLHRNEVRAKRKERDVQTLTDLAEDILERVDSGLLVVNSTGQVQLSNPEAERLLNPVPLDGENNLGDRFPRLEALFKEWLSGRGQDYGELAISSLEDLEAPHTLAYRFTPLGGSEGEDALIHLYDLTKARQRQREQERTERLAALGRLSANLAHEIRNPLSSIQHAGQLLTEQGGNSRITDIIQQESDRLNDWVETLLRHLRPPSGQAQTVELAPVVANTVRLLGSEGCPEGGGCFYREVPEGLTACIDEGHLQQILWNLGVNAIRHGRTGESEGGTIRALPLGEGFTRLEVLDRGPGIAGGDRERVFEPFFTTASGGTGLGLGLVRELVEANQGTIAIQDRPGGGTCVAVELPTQCDQRG